MLPINKKITKVNRTVIKNKKNLFIVIHYVGAVSTAKNNADYFYSVNRGASASYFVDDTSIWQVVEDKDAGWHCGTTGTYYHKTCRNTNSIGIEMCCYKNNGKLDISDKTIENTIELTKYLMKKYNIPVKNVVRHYDVTHKKCPAPFVSDESRWLDFKSNLVDKIEYKEIDKKKIELVEDTYLFNFVDNKNIKAYKKGEKIEVVAIAEYKGNSYYLTEYSYKNKITNGFKVEDCEELKGIDNEPVGEQGEPGIEEPIPEPVIEEPITQGQPLLDSRTEQSSFVKIINVILDFIISLFKK